MTSLDSLILDDLRALGADGDALPDAGVFRDGTAGATARRDELAATSAREVDRALAALGPIYARRTARAIAAVCAAVLAETMTLVLGATDVRPRTDGTLLLFCGLGAVVAFFAIGALARPLAARSFERWLRTAVAPHGDLYAQIDRLSVSPWGLARARIDATDRRPTLAATVGIAVMLEIAFVVFGFALADTRSLAPVGHSLLWLSVAALAPAAAAMAVVGWSFDAAPTTVAKVRKALTLPGVLTLFVTSAANNAFPFVPVSCAVFAITAGVALGLHELEQKKLAKLA